MNLMKKDIDKSKKEEPDEPETKFKEINYQIIAKEYQKNFLQFAKALNSYKRYVKRNIKRQIKIIKPDISKK